VKTTRFFLSWIIFFGIAIGNVQAQTSKEGLDLIVTIDDKVWITNTYFTIVLINKLNVDDTLKVNYYPGNLSINKSIYDKLLSDETKKIFFEFEYSRYKGNQQSTYNYKIEVLKPWLNDYFNVLHIYNLKDRKRHSKSSSERNYTYDLDSPSHSFRRIR
jgi:hypothetical protein